MNQYHDPIIQIGYIRQCLSHDKRPLGLFIGAGCPLAVKESINGTEKPIVPDIEGLTEVVNNSMKTSEYSKQYETIINHLKNEEGKSTDIEEILSYVRLLKSVAGRVKIADLELKDFEKLDENICKIIVETMDKQLPEFDTPYHKITNWIGAIRRDDPVEIFTTNYDLLFEQSLDMIRVPYFDGFIGTYRPFFDLYAVEEEKELSSRWARLWKLHGSINWNQDKDGLVCRGQKNNESQPRVIHPSHLKYEQSRKMPYLAMTDRLKTFLKKQSSVLVICGYSFRDDHLNDVIVQGLKGNPNAYVFSLIYGELKKHKKAIDNAKRSINLGILAKDEAIIGSRQASWIAKKELSDSDNIPFIDWIEKESGSEEKKAVFKLGDFEIFGNFIESIIGLTKKEDEPKNV